MSKSKWQEFKELFQRGKSIGWYFRNFINLIDDPFDNFKHWLNGEHCLVRWGTFWIIFEIRLPDWLMRGRGNPDK